MYKCINCGRELDIDLSSGKKMICPFCGYRIVEKKRAEVVKSVDAE